MINEENWNRLQFVLYAPQRTLSSVVIRFGNKIIDRFTNRKRSIDSLVKSFKQYVFNK